MASSGEKLDKLYDHLGDLILHTRFQDLETELRNVPLGETETDILIGYLTNILVVSGSEIEYAQTFRDQAISELKGRRGYEPGWTSGLEKYSDEARDAQEKLFK